MKNVLTIMLLVAFGVCCQSNNNSTETSEADDKLTVTYTGEADVVLFKMFEGLSQLLTQDSITRDFKGVIDIPNLEEAIFTFDIVAYKFDSSGQSVQVVPNKSLIKLNNKTAVETRNGFLWIGSNRSGLYEYNSELEGSLITNTIQSTIVGEERAVTVYTPQEVDPNTPLIYFTDGSVVTNYAYFVDRLISTNKIKPVKLIGVHASRSNRSDEYVKGYGTNQVFEKHQQFFYEDVVTMVESEIDNWEGERYLYGFSNGAAFCIHEGINKPNKYKEIIAFSTAGYITNPLSLLSEEQLKQLEELEPKAKEEILRPQYPIEFNHERYPMFYMGAGRYEESIFKDNIEFVKLQRDNDIQVDFKEFVSGHDRTVWRIEFLEYLEKRFEK